MIRLIINWLLNVFYKERSIIEAEKYVIPREYVMEILEIADRIHEANSDCCLSFSFSDCRLSFSLWSSIEKIFPDLVLTEGEWSLNTSDNILAPYIYRKG